MNRRAWIGTVAVLALAFSAMAVRAAEQAKLPDLTGQWRLDPQKSDLPQRPPEGMRGGGGGGWGAGGGWGGRGGRGGGGGGREAGGAGGGERADAARARPVRLPEMIHITSTPTLVSVEDTSGTVLEEIATVSAEADTFARAPGAQHVSGTWKGDQLTIEREGPRGKVTETFSLDHDLLIVRTKMEGNGDMPAREFKRAYRRVLTTG